MAKTGRIEKCLLQVGDVECSLDLYEEFRSLDRRLNPQQDDTLDSGDVHEVLGAGFVTANTETLKKVTRAVRLVRRSGGAVLITGDTGTGKEIVARAIGSICRGDTAPFMAENCGAISPSLVSARLFGCVKGAFTDAVNRAGSFEQAKGGSLLLDEIGEMPLEAQVALLRVLDENKIKREGGTEEIPVDVQIMAATNRNVEELVTNAKFREDLMHRLNTVQVALRPLEQRPADLCLLLWYEIKKWNNQPSTSITHVSSLVLYELVAHRWPGNVRELKSAIGAGIGEVECEKLLTMGGKVLEVDDGGMIPKGLLDRFTWIPIDDIPVALEPLMADWESRMPTGCPAPWKPEGRCLGDALRGRVLGISPLQALARVELTKSFTEAIGPIFSRYEPKKEQLMEEYYRWALRKTDQNLEHAHRVTGVAVSTLRPYREDQ